MTATITTSKGTFLFVGVPANTIISKGYASEPKPYILKFADGDVVIFGRLFNKTIGKGDIIGLLSTITEDQAREVVSAGLKNETAIGAVKRLMQANGINTDEFPDGIILKVNINK